MDDDHRRQAAVRAAERISQLNLERDDKFQDTAMGEIRLALEAFRPDVEADLPGPGDDALFDALMHLTRELDASPETVSLATHRVLELAAPREGSAGGLRVSA
jgi:hypothetical protein